jgi:hypothetical protein
LWQLALRAQNQKKMVAPQAPHMKLGARRRKFGDAYNQADVVSHDTVPANIPRPKSGKRVGGYSHTPQNNQENLTQRKMLDHRLKTDHNVIAQTGCQPSPNRQTNRARNPAHTKQFGSCLLGREEKRQSPRKVTGLRHIRSDRGTNMANALAWGC